MKTLHLFTAVCLASLLIVGCSQKETIFPSDEESLILKSASVAGKYIVVLKEDAEIASANLTTRNDRVKAKAFGLLKKYEVSGEIEEVYETALQGFTVRMAPGQAKKMEMDLNVGYIEADKVISLSPIEMKAKPGGTTPPPESTPWGITRVGGGAIYTGPNVAWIIDTGIDLDHPDLNVDLTHGWNFVTGTLNADDDNGHGSHCAGIVAAEDNTIGVVGVAAGATVVPVKVLNKRGSGAYSAIIAGVNFVAANGKSGDVANMSLGGPYYLALNQAVSNAAGKGILFSLAAGNESTDAGTKSPASTNGPNIYTVSAMDSADKFAYFSNYGNPPIDYCAPGVSIYSTYKGGGYTTLSGTSMAAPHVAGVLLWGSIHTSGAVINDPDGNPDPIAHK
ncbi:MAG: S8 family peptidase [Prolixibacteraceae bacterium]|nr:S8 family peptidase [Prolixibacteraceae bacterium]